MNLPRFSVRNPVPVNLMMIGIIVLGLFAGSRLIREFFPNIEAEQISVTTVYPGATPEEIERSVTRVIERGIEGVDGIDELQSRIFEGVTVVTAKLVEGVDRDRVLNDIRGEVDKIQGDLPDGAEDPEVAEQRPYIPAIAVVVSGRVGEERIHDVARDVRDELLDLDEVTEVVVTGLRDRELHVELRPEVLDAYGLTFQQVGLALAALNLDLPGGQLEGPTNNIRVRTMGEVRTAHALEAHPLFTDPAGRVIRLGEVARVRPAFEDKVEVGRFRARAADEDPDPAPEDATGVPPRAVMMTVFKAPEQDAIAIAEAVRRFVRERPERLGGAVALAATTDLSRIIEGRIELLSRNALTGLVLVLIVLALFLELRIAFWVAVGLAVSFMGTFLVMALTGQSINLISLFGLIVVLGLIVDDAIVIGENIFARQRSGLPPMKAAEVGTNEVAIPVVAAVLTTCAAFGPLAFIEGRMGDFLGVIPPVVICALGMSLVEAFLILPGHLAHGRHRPVDVATLPAWRRAWHGWHRIRQRVFGELLPGALGRVLRVLVPWRYAALAGGVALLMLSIGLVAGGIVPFVLLQDTDAETLTAKLEMAAGTPESVTLETLAAVESIALAQPEVRSAFAVLGASFSDRGRETASDPATVGMVTLELFPAEDRQAAGQRTSLSLLDDLRAATADFRGVRRLSFTSQGGGPGGADVEIRVRADDLPTLERGVEHVRGILVDYEGVSEIYDDLQLGKLEARLTLREAARLQGLTTRDVALQIRSALFGFEAQDLQIGDEEVTVRAVLPKDRRTGLADLADLRIALPEGGRMPFEEAVAFTMRRGYAGLARVDGKRAATIRAEVNERVANVAKVNQGLVRDLADIGEQVPGASVSFEGARKETNESVGSLAWLFPIALMLIYCIIAVLFRSYVQPVIVMFSIPFALGGAIVGHAIMGYPFTILSMIGGVALAGIVVNDGLILVDLANRRRRAGEPLHEAVIGAAQGRMRAILLTSITTCVGLAPLMLEKSFQAQFLIPMAVSIVFGLAFATFVILLLMPLIYLVLEDVRACLRWFLGGRFSTHLPWDPVLMDETVETEA